MFWRRIQIFVVVLVLGFAGYVGYRIAGPRERVPGVVSIATTHDYQDPALLARANALPVARLYRGYLSQPNGSVCGPTSIADVQRSLGDRDATVDSVRHRADVCPTSICFGGLTLDELAQVARRVTGRRVRVIRGLDLERFRALLRTSNDPNRRIVANFDRGPLFGLRGGHHSPVAGYLEDVDRVLVLDVNARYRPWLVSPERLLGAIRTVDPTSRRERGLLVIE